MKVKCTNAVSPSDKKAAPFFVKGKEYDAQKVGADLFVTGEAKRRNGSMEWQAVAAFPKGWVVAGVAIFDEVAQ